jgi:flavin-dependent dehydrogenase
MTEVDVLVVGAGPAGATAALNLAPTRNVLLLDWRDFRSPGGAIGESLVPAARRLFSDMGLLEAFLAGGHAPWYGNRSAWGGEGIAESDLIRDIDGHGWHLDRALFDAWLRQMAVERGVRLFAPARVPFIERDSQGWRAKVSGHAGSVFDIRAGAVVDASGKFATLARRFGARQGSAEPRMIGVWLAGDARETPSTGGFTMVEAMEDGWWYTAPLPHARRALAFHTDPDLPSGRIARSAAALMRHAAGAPFLAATLKECGFSCEGEVRLTIANGGALYPVAGPAWFAAGDAAIHFDPLASQGIFNALFTGLASAEAADRLLEGDDPEGVAEGYIRLIAGIETAYRSRRMVYYCQERRWPGAPFWARRHAERPMAERAQGEAAVRRDRAG